MLQLTDTQLADVVQELQTGLLCYLNRHTGTLVSFPDPLNDYDNDEVWDEDRATVDENPDDYLRIEPMPGREAFRVMEQFVETLPAGVVRNRLERALDKAHPFREFKYQIDNAGEFRNQWFAFRDAQQVQWLRQYLALHEDV